uniref:Uncharacterized protein n=1 Tax=Seriola dumerili TaxID=41447 RepID=A0A3B4TCZ5_SERDU
SRTHATVFCFATLSTGPLSPATPDLNIWEANLSPSPERDKAGNQPLCRNWSLCCIVFSLSLNARLQQVHCKCHVFHFIFPERFNILVLFL